MSHQNSWLPTRSARWLAAMLTVGTALGGAALSPASAGAHKFHGPHSGKREAANHRGHPTHVRGHRGRLGPTVTRTGTGPTGYTVTFRYYAPHANSVQIKGEWYFAPLGTPASTATSVVATPGILPAQWEPGDFPIASPNSTSANWPVSQMTFNHRTGVWSYTTPLPSGTFTYGFFVNCSATPPAMTGCTELSDPANPPFNDRRGQSTGSVEPDSSIYVPSDHRFGTVNFSWQAPAQGARGTLTDVTYPSPGHITPVNENYLAVYTPPGYNAHRAAQYPTLYLSHGGGGNEVDWATQGDLRNIMDRLIDTGQIEPMVVVMPNNNGYPNSADNSAYITDLAQNMIPYIESHYDVSASPSERAFSGLSAGGLVTNDIMLHDPALFGYYGVMSAGIPADNESVSSPQAAALADAGIFVGGGWQEPVHAQGYNGFDTGTAQEVSILTHAGLTVTPDFINGGHEWYTWRILLRDFLTRVAFWPSPTGP